MTWRLSLVGLAIVALLVPLPPPLVERVYSSFLFPVIQSVATRASNLTAVAWFDVFVGLALGAVITLSVRDGRKYPARRAMARVCLRLLTVGAAIYLLFLLTWGLNYRRQPLREKVAFDSGRITPAALQRLAGETVTRANETYDAARREGFPQAWAVSPGLAQSFARTSAALGIPGSVVPGRPKRSALDLYFRRAGVAGMTDPFFLETLVASDLLPFERPMVVAHEWAHLAGITDEGEANFVGWLACVRGTAAQRYSGWLFLYSEAVSGLPAALAQAVSQGLASGPRADLQAIRERHAREVSPRLASAGWKVYDRYLKANRVDAGTASYAEVVRLVLGTDLR